MSEDRLAELRRQRAHAAEMLAWLDREIAAAEAVGKLTGKHGKAGDPAQADKVRLPAQAEPAAYSAPMADHLKNARIEAEAERILDENRVDPQTVRAGVFRGCLWYMILGFVALGVGTVALYYAFRMQ